MIKHSKVSIAPSDGNTDHIQGSDWNDDHSIDDAASLTAALNAFAGSIKGLVPVSVGGIANVLRADGSWSPPPGRLLAIQLLTAPSGTYTPTTGTKCVRVRMVGGGGGSGGVPTCSGNQAVSGGGASGTYVEFVVGTPGAASAITGGAFVCGAAGAAGATTPTDGGTGGDTTIVVGSTFTAKGGGGGAQGLAAASGLRQAGSSQAGSSAGLFNAGSFGSPGLNLSATIFFGGAGGGSPLGAGGPIGQNGGIGTAGIGYGSGAGGSATNGTSRTGVAGNAGCIIVEEYA